MENRDYNDPRYKAWRDNVFVRDGWTCQLCNATSSSISPIVAHHIVRWVESEQLRFIITNGITLCSSCHDRVTGHEDEYKDKFRRIVQQKILAGKIQSKINRGTPKHKNEKYYRHVKVKKLSFSPRVTLFNRRYAVPAIPKISYVATRLKMSSFKKKNQPKDSPDDL